MKALTGNQIDEVSCNMVIPWVLRIGVAGCFIGHGAFGIITKSGWLPYFAVAGIDEPLAWKLMPLVGTMDITMGLLALFWPCRALFLWAALWATWTALLRPLTGEPVWEFLERAGNYGVPITILLVVGTGGALFSRLPAVWDLDPARCRRMVWGLRMTTALLLAGHAGLGFFSHKVGLAEHYAALGFENAAGMVPMVGAFEFFLVALVLLLPSPGLLIGVCVWKVATESLFLVAGAPYWEVIERFGSYAAPVALALLFIYRRQQRRAASRWLLSGFEVCATARETGFLPPRTETSRIENRNSPRFSCSSPRSRFPSGGN